MGCGYIILSDAGTPKYYILDFFLSFPSDPKIDCAVLFGWFRDPIPLGLGVYNTFVLAPPFFFCPFFIFFCPPCCFFCPYSFFLLSIFFCFFCPIGFSFVPPPSFFCPFSFFLLSFFFFSFVFFLPGSLFCPKILS